MTLPPGEPNDAAAVSAWVTKQARARDPFAHVYDASEAHRLEHGPGCSVYPTGSGPLLGTLAAAVAARHILEVGCGLGYSALWLAFGSSPDGRVETVEQDPTHADLSSRNFQREGYGAQITAHQGRSAEILPSLTGPYDLIFCDSDLEEYLANLEHFLRLLRPGGLLVSSNLFLGQYAPDLPGLEQAAAYRLRILDDERLLTAFLPGGLALSVRKQ
ncbi:MAG TPA: class I SAM-dependent methyltransferase [Dehalococcoidia bacterium]|nr:class I SAM-dependent methyltransferase [Dehalococcoidia bacterium]